MIGFFIILSIAIAQQTKIELNFIGYADTYQENIISFTNMGDTNIEGITFYVDSEEIKTINVFLTPGYGVQHNFLLEEGEHVIEAKTPEGAYDSLRIKVQGGEVPLPPEIEKRLELAEEGSSPLKIIIDNILGIIAVFLIFILVVLWLEKRKGK